MTNTPTTITGPPYEAQNPPFPALEIDWALYDDYLRDMPEDQRKEFIETLWNVIVGFVDLGFGIHPVQQALDQSFREACGQDQDNGIISPDDLVKLQPESEER